MSKIPSPLKSAAILLKLGSPLCVVVKVPVPTALVPSAPEFNVKLL